MDPDNEARKILLEWSLQKGHDRCWWYPEYIQPLAKLYDLSLDDVMLTPLDRIVFDKGCVRFRQEQYGGIKRSRPNYTNARECLSNWIDQQKGKEYSYQDEILQDLAIILDVAIPSTPNVSRKELEQGCNRFQKIRYE